MFVLGNLVRTLAFILNQVLILYGWVVLAAVLITWINQDPFNPIVRVLRGVTDPVFEWVRRRLPFAMMGMLDLSPMLVMFAIWFLKLFLVQTLLDISYRLR